MSDSQIIYLDKILESEPYVFYNKSCSSIELNNSDNIELFNRLLKHFNQQKPFIENTKEEFQKSGKSSDELNISILRINSKNYDFFVKQLEKEAFRNSKNLEKEYKKSPNNKRSLLFRLKELLELLSFITKYQDLIEREDYKNYSYYVISE